MKKEENALTIRKDLIAEISPHLRKCPPVHLTSYLMITITSPILNVTICNCQFFKSWKKILPFKFSKT